jgi:hypothetical protein
MIGKESAGLPPGRASTSLLVEPRIRHNVADGSTTKKEAAMPSLTRGDMVKYLTETRSHFLSYHNHKETLAWASIVLYLGAVGAVGLPVGRMYAWQCTLYTLGSLLALALASSYARRQFNMRELASRIIMACNLLILELLAGTIQAEDWTAKDILPDGAVSGEVRMPSKPAPLTTSPIVSLQARLTALAHSVTVSIFPPRVPTVPSLPRLVTRKMQPAGSDNRVREFETLGYLIMAGPTLILVALKWSATVR